MTATTTGNPTASATRPATDPAARHRRRRARRAHHQLDHEAPASSTPDALPRRSSSAIAGVSRVWEAAALAAAGDARRARRPCPLSAVTIQRSNVPISSATISSLVCSPLSGLAQVRVRNVRAITRLLTPNRLTGDPARRTAARTPADPASCSGTFAMAAPDTRQYRTGSLLGWATGDHDDRNADDGVHEDPHYGHGGGVAARGPHGRQHHPEQEHCRDGEPRVLGNEVDDQSWAGSSTSTRRQPEPLVKRHVRVLAPRRAGRRSVKVAEPSSVSRTCHPGRSSRRG